MGRAAELEGGGSTGCGQGLDPLPLPADYEGLPAGRFDPVDLLPSAKALHVTERAWHEYLGMLVLRLGGE